jgi:DNA-binding CsgD family transcriptional regulator
MNRVEPPELSIVEAVEGDDASLPFITAAPPSDIVASPLPLFVIRLPDQVVLTANAAAKAMLGIKNNELIGREASELVVPHESADTRLALEALTAGAMESYHAHHTFIGPSGEVDAWVWVRSIPRPSGGLALLLMLPAPHDELIPSASRSLMGPLAVDLASGTLTSSGMVVTLLRGNADVLPAIADRPLGTWHLTSQVHADDQPRLVAALLQFKHDSHDVVLGVRVRHADRGWIASDCHLFSTGDAQDDEPVGFVLAEATARAPDSGRVAELERSLGRIAVEIESTALAPSDLTASDDDEATVAKLAGLTARQRQIVTMLMGGARVPSIAAALFVSRSTVRNHLASVYTAFGVHSQSELIDALRPVPRPTD